MLVSVYRTLIFESKIPFSYSNEIDFEYKSHYKTVRVERSENNSVDDFRTECRI